MPTYVLCLGYGIWRYFLMVNLINTFSPNQFNTKFWFILKLSKLATTSLSDSLAAVERRLQCQTSFNQSSVFWFRHSRQLQWHHVTTKIQKNMVRSYRIPTLLPHRRSLALSPHTLYWYKSLWSSNPSKPLLPVPNHNKTQSSTKTPKSRYDKRNLLPVSSSAEYPMRRITHGHLIPSRPLPPFPLPAPRFPPLLFWTFPSPGKNG